MKIKYLLSVAVGTIMAVSLFIFILLSREGLATPLKELISLIPLGISVWIIVHLSKRSSIVEVLVYAGVSAETFSILYSLLGATSFRGLIKGIAPFSENFYVAHLKMTLLVYIPVLIIFFLSNGLSGVGRANRSSLRRKPKSGQ